MGIRTKTCTICAVVIFTSLQPIISQFMTLHMKPYIIHTLELLLDQRRVNTAQPKKDMEFEKNSLLTLSSTYPVKYFILKNIQ